MSRIMRRGRVFLLLSAAAAGACGMGADVGGSGLAAERVDGAVLAAAADYGGDWLTHGRDYGEQRYSPLAQIDAGNVGRLGLAWSLETETDRGLEATPIVVGGTMYTTGSWSVVFAVDGATGELLWRWDPEVDRRYGQRACCDVVNRGAAVYRGKVYVGVLDGRLVALDAGTGEVVWEVMTVDPGQPYTITGAPRVVAGHVIIGNGGAEYGVRGYVSAYDAETGELVWRFYTVPGDPSQPFESPAMEYAARTWTGEWWRYGGGGTVWDALAYDPELDLLYVGTGNGSPWNREIRSPGGGDNLFLASIVALRPATGELVWYYQTTPGETWDYTATQHMLLADLEIRGETRKVLMQAPKNGFFYVLDRETGELISAEIFADEITWATGVDPETGRPIEVPGARYEDEHFVVKPGPLGAHNWHPMSYNPNTGLVYIPAQDNAFVYEQVSGFAFRPEAWNTGVDFFAGRRVAVRPPTGHLLAWDPVAQQERWRVQYDDMWNGGTLTTAGNLVFQGSSDGRFKAFAADTGERLWEVRVGTGIIAPPVTYTANGVQYVAVMVGWGGSYGVTGGGAGRPVVPGRMLAFALGGTGTLTAPAAEDREPPAPIDYIADAAAIDAGGQLYAQFCSVCHGAAAVSGTAIPDLRYATPETYDAFDDIVLGGARQDRGMPAFETLISREDAGSIRTYLLDRRAALLR